MAQETRPQPLRHLRQVDVRIVYLAAVHGLAEIDIRRIRRTETDAVRTGQRPVARVAGRGTRDDAHLEVFATGMSFCGQDGQGSRHGFRTAGRRKAAQAQNLTVFYQTGGLGRRHSCIAHSVNS